MIDTLGIGDGTFYKDEETAARRFETSSRTTAFPLKFSGSKISKELWGDETLKLAGRWFLGVFHGCPLFPPNRIENFGVGASLYRL